MTSCCMALLGGLYLQLPPFGAPLGEVGYVAPSQGRKIFRPYRLYVIDKISFIADKVINLAVVRLLIL